MNIRLLVHFRNGPFKVASEIKLETS